MGQRSTAIIKSVVQDIYSDNNPRTEIEITEM